MLYAAERAETAYFMRRLYRQCLTTTSGGNLSRRVSADEVVVTASKSDKAELHPEQIGIVGLDGENRTPELALSIETGMHLAIYRALPDVRAIVHAHPVTASAFCASAVPLSTHYTAEGYAIVGDPVFVPYELMGTEDLATRVADGLKDGALCVLLENHGVLTVGQTLLQAFDRLEVLEVAARHTVLLSQLGQSRELQAPQLAELDRFMGRDPAPRA
ncbi:MAG: class II aldolase/adducin family protein [Victivallales bacterium]|jgi:L-fuculose-phosphate aldolase|nr:class II aldolase/adducin family protein [Victivallales bacterium]MBT7298212.1 class II aldolase/adducin family protein [Victivallales bacterium]